MDSFADNNALTRYTGKIKDRISTKSDFNHKHNVVNGIKVVISDTVPTNVDDSVITLIVDSAHVPVNYEVTIWYYVGNDSTITNTVIDKKNADTYVRLYVDFEKPESEGGFGPCDYTMYLDDVELFSSSYSSYEDTHTYRTLYQRTISTWFGNTSVGSHTLTAVCTNSKGTVTASLPITIIDTST